MIGFKIAEQVVGGKYISESISMNRNTNILVFSKSTIYNRIIIQLFRYFFNYKICEADKLSGDL